MWYPPPESSSQVQLDVIDPTVSGVMYDMYNIDHGTVGALGVFSYLQRDAFLRVQTPWGTSREYLFQRCDLRNEGPMKSPPIISSEIHIPFPKAA